MQQISDFGSSAWALIGHLLPLALLAAIVVLIVARRLRMNLRLPSLPRMPVRRKRVPPLRVVKGPAMDRQLAELLRNERRRDGRN